MRIAFAAISLAFTSAATLPAQQPAGLSAAQDSALEQTIRAAMATHKIPAVSMAITRAGSILFERSYGITDIENTVHARNESMYRIASVSKPITAVAVMQLVARGLLDLDAPIQTYVPEYPLHAQPVTIRHLLLHTSGIRHYNNEAEFSTTKHCEKLVEGIEVFRNDSLVHAPGEKITYSTYGFVLLGLAVEKASGARFTDYLRAHIFTPAQMFSTQQDRIYDIIPYRARGYERDETGQLRNPPLVDTSCRIPAGGLLSTAGDLARFLIALDAGLLLPPAARAQMFTNHVTADLIKRTVGGQEIPAGYVFPGFGFGWAIHTQKHRDVLWHGGNQQGATSMIYWLPTPRVGIAILTNLGEQGNAITALADEVTSIVMQRP